MTTVLTRAAPLAVRRRSPWAAQEAPVPGTGRPRVLVAFASRHGATRELAAALARWLPLDAAVVGREVTTVLTPVQERPDPAAFDAVVLGSAVYGGHWLEPARSYADAGAAVLRGRPTWLFSSGTAGGAAGSSGQVDEALRIAGSVGARDHRFFGGRLEPRMLSVAERRDWPPATGAAGDRREWPALRAWSAHIAAEVTEQRTLHGAG